MIFKRVKPKDYNLQFTDLTPRDDTSRIVIHHTGNPTDDDLSAEQLHRSHLNLGWAGVGYHFIMRKDGTVELGRPDWTVGAHAEGFNYVPLVSIFAETLILPNLPKHSLTLCRCC